MKLEERRTFRLGELRSIAAEGAEHPRIAGHAAVFNSLSEPLWGFRETIAPGAFREAIENSDVRALLNHDSNLILGRKKNGTLRLWEDERGLAVEIDPPATRWAEDLLVSIGRGDIDQMSFGFRVGEDRWETVEGEARRTILWVQELFDVSPVTFPAYPETDVSLRARFDEELKALASPPTGTSPLDILTRRLRLLELTQ